MAKADLSPLSSLDPGNAATLSANNFQRLDLLSEVEKDIDSGIVNVTGTLIVTTALSSVEGVVVSFAALPTNNNLHVYATVVANSGNITITVLNQFFAVTAFAILVQYVAVGVMSL